MNVLFTKSMGRQASAFERGILSAILFFIRHAVLLGRAFLSPSAPLARHEKLLPCLNAGKGPLKGKKIPPAGLDRRDLLIHRTLDSPVSWKFFETFKFSENTFQPIGLTLSKGCFICKNDSAFDAILLRKGSGHRERLLFPARSASLACLCGKLTFSVEPPFHNEFRLFATKLSSTKLLNHGTHLFVKFTFCEKLPT